MKKVLAIISLGIFLTGGFADNGSQHYVTKEALAQKLKPETGCPYLEGQSSCPYKNQINKNYIIKKQDLIKQIRKT